MPEDLTIAIYGCAGFAVACQVVSMLTREHSWVDRLWSITPILYVGWFAISVDRVDPRLMLMAALVAAWGVRLTYNFARKGGYHFDGEDYRWPELRRRIGPVGFQFMNATFIAPFQNLLLFLIASPAYAAWRDRGAPLNSYDALAASGFLLFLVGESVADQQQWAFQQDKAARKARGEAVSSEFLDSGLFRYSRHPNFFCEQGIWWTFYLFAVASSGRWLDWPISGAVLLTLLFQGSTWLTEWLTLQKYPEYAAYQSRTSRLLPLPPRGSGAGDF